MKTKFDTDMVSPKCPIRNVLSRICDKWSILVLCILEQEGIMRFNALHKNIPEISQKMLTVTLRTLEEDGLVKRNIYAEVPPRVEYNLTERGNSFVPLLKELVIWAKENMDEIISQRANIS